MWFYIKAPVGNFGCNRDVWDPTGVNSWRLKELIQSLWSVFSKKSPTAEWEVEHTTPRVCRDKALIFRPEIIGVL